MDGLQPDVPGWPTGGGAMGALVRAHAWAQTPLGPLEAWPQRLRDAVDTALSCAFPMIVLWGPDLVQVYNDGYRALMGVKHPAGLSQPTRDCWPEVWHINAPIYARVWAGETLTFADALYPITRSGALEDAWFTLCYSPLHDTDGTVAGILVTVFETTARVRADRARAEADETLRASKERQAFLLRLSDALRPLGAPADVKIMAARVLGAHLHANRVCYAEVDGETWFLEGGYEDGVAPLPLGRYPLAVYGHGLAAALTAGRWVVYGDVRHESRLTPEERERRLALQLVAAVAAPLVKNGRLVAVFLVHAATVRAWSAEELALVEETAERTWAAVERARAEAALRASEDNYRTLFTTMDQGFCLIEQVAATSGDPIDFRYLTANPAFERHTGMHDVVGQTIRALVPDADRERVAGGKQRILDVYEEVARTGQSRRFAAHVAALDLWMEAEVVPTPTPGQLAVLFSNVSERKRAEEALRVSEARFRSFAESSANTLWIVGAARRQLEYLSPSFERMWGEPRDAVLRDLGRWAALVHPEDREQASHVMPRVLAGEAVVVDYRIVRSSDGAVRWIRDTGFPIRDERGRVARVAGIAQDITDQKAAEAALRAAHEGLERRVAERTAELAAAIENLRASETRLRLLLEQMPAALWTTDRDLRVTTLTGALASTLPAARRNVVGRTMVGLFPPPGPNANGETAPIAAHHQALAGASVGFEVELEDRTYAAHVEPLRDAEGRIVGTIGVAHDVTERTLLRLQDEFLALASHELRTPLTPTMGYLEMAPQALAAGDTERAARYVARATEQVGRLNELVGDLLEVGRLRGGKLELAREEVDLGAAVGRAVEAAEVEAGAQGQALALDAPAEPLRIRGDARRLEQVVLNLLTNAVKYAPGSPTIAVGLWRDTGAGQAVLEVTDAGLGIPEADLPHLFSRFYQVARADRPSRGGLGLGLYLVKELVEAHGGTVAVASVVGAGTTFTVRLPLTDAGTAAPTAEEGETHG